MEAAVFQSLGVTSGTYPKSSIKVKYLGSVSRSATSSSAQLTDLESSATPAAVQPTVRGVIYRAEIAEPPGSPSNLPWRLIASPVSIIPGQPFGNGITAQACDDNGYVANPIGVYLAFLQSGGVRLLVK
jgi:hypothetical protein